MALIHSCRQQPMQMTAVDNVGERGPICNTSWSEAVLGGSPDHFPSVCPAQIANFLLGLARLCMPS